MTTRRYMKLMSLGGQILKKTRPTMSLFGIAPKQRESLECLRLSPITQ